MCRFMSRMGLTYLVYPSSYTGAWFMGSSRAHCHSVSYTRPSALHRRDDRNQPFVNQPNAEPTGDPTRHLPAQCGVQELVGKVERVSEGYCLAADTQRERRHTLAHPARLLRVHVPRFQQVTHRLCSVHASTHALHNATRAHTYTHTHTHTHVIHHQSTAVT